MGEADGTLFFVMEYVRGQNARQICRSGPLAVRRAVGLACQLLEALEYAHAEGFVHRDIKPANVMVAREESREIIKLADFGLARVYQMSELSGLTVTGDTGGSPQFMAPEQITRFRDVQPASDQYAAAATLYFLLSKKPPFEVANIQELCGRILHDDPLPLRQHRPEVSAPLAQAIHRALSREPDERFADVIAFRRALLEAMT
jgi:serine/threonine-protein kinase